jgi:hypothetical protein
MMTSNGIVIDGEDRLHALLVAEGGLAIAFKKIDPSTFETLADGTEIWSEQINMNRSTRVIKSTNAFGKPILLASGTVDKKVILGNIITVTRTIEAVVGFNSRTGSFPSGAFGMSNLDVGGNFFTDSYDSSKGVYRVNGNVGNMGNIGTNGELTYHGSFIINGNATPGPDQQPIVDSRITGSGTPLVEPVIVTIPPYIVPNNANTTFSSTLNGTNGVGAPPTNYNFPTLTNQPKDTLLVSGKVNIFVDGDIDLKGAIRLADANSVLTIYQKDGTITINGGGNLNTGTMITVPEQTIVHPATTVNYPATTRTISRDSTNQSAPVLGPNESIANIIYSNGRPETRYVTQYIIAVAAHSEVVPAYTEVIPEHTEYVEAGIPSNFNIISNTTQAVKINGNSTYYGTLVAPNAPVTLNGTADKFGAVIGSTMTLLGTGNFHNDTKAQSPGLIRTPTLLSYREVNR